MTFDSHTTAQRAAAILGKEIRGRNLIVTGASPGGLGAEACLAIAEHAPGVIVLAGRSRDKLLQTQKDILEHVPETQVRILVMDQSSLASVRNAATEVNSYPEAIDVLICGAGIMHVPYAKTVDGFESCFATNHLSHFLFTNLIKPSLAKSKAPRIVNLTSVGHKWGKIDWEDIGFSNGERYDKGAAHAQSKGAVILSTVELASRWKPIGVTAVSVHPGGIQTNLGSHISAEELKGWGVTVDENGKWHSAHPMKSRSEGAATYIVAAFDPVLKDYSGSYMDDCQVANDKAAAYALDKANARTMWELSEKMVGETFD